MDDFGIEQTINRLGQSIVATVANAADRGLNACFGQSFRVFDRQMLGQIQLVVATPLDRAAFMDRLFEGVENEAGMGNGADPPADNAPGIGIDDDRNIEEPLPRGDIGVFQGARSRVSMWRM